MSLIDEYIQEAEALEAREKIILRELPLLYGDDHRLALKRIGTIREEIKELNEVIRYMCKHTTIRKEG